jgi:lysophospholipase L1-like esterase
METKRLFAAVSVVAATGGLAVLCTAGAAGGRPVYQPPQGYYLALGDSMAYGVQPTKIKPGLKPSNFATGYVDVFAAKLRKLAPGIKLVNYGCPGESSVTFVRGGCPAVRDGIPLHDRFRGTQLKAALAFLRSHPGDVSPITLTLWGNDLAPLSQQAHAQREIAAFGTRFGSILKQLRTAAPGAEIIVSGAWNPEADRLATVEGLYRSVDAAIAKAAGASGVRVAKMFPALNGSGGVPAQKARLCRLTFYCGHFDHDPHPTDAGYQAMAGAFVAASGYGS